MKNLFPLLATTALCVAFLSSLAYAQDQSTSQNVRLPVETRLEIKHDVSAPLRDIVPIRPTGHHREVDVLRRIPVHSNPAAPNRQDEALQSSVNGPRISTVAGKSILGVGADFVGPQGAYLVGSIPPDTEGVVGATQYVQWVNTAFAVFNKSTGAVVYGPADGNTLWTGFGGPCETNNDGDPIAQYDKAANRWILTQFSVTGGPPFYQCVAISTTSDATGSYTRYAFQYANFNDYPKLGVWPDAYYISYNMFQGNSFIGSQVCAFDRSKMLAGQAATQQCVQLSSSFGGLLPSDLDGATPPPAGSPNYYVAFGANVLQLWKFHVDWTTPANSTFTGPKNIPVAAFNAACNGGGTCIPQSGTTQQLDSLADRLMYRLAYRNFGDHESLVVNHSVDAGSGRVGVRWYELRSPGAASPTVFQQGTFAPSDTLYRWMGSIAMDKVGNIAMGYSVSDSNSFPSIKFTGRVPGDTLGTMETEANIITGSGSQDDGSGSVSRWGDYSAMTVDPVDDCTMWYTNEYLPATGAFNWDTHINSFRFPTCQQTALSSVKVSPTMVVGGTPSNGTITLTSQATGAGAVVTLMSSNTAVATVPASMTVDAGATTAPFTVTTKTVTSTQTVTITATYSGVSKTATLTVVPATPAVTLSQTSLNFGNQTVGTTSAVKTVMLTNSGNATLTISGIVATVDYAETNTCGSSLAPGANCKINVTFHPTAKGTRTGAVVITDNASCESIQAVMLTGLGQ